MANSDVRVNLTFGANTQEAKREIQDLQKTLRSLVQYTSSNPKSLFDDKQMSKASTAARELQQHLDKALNVNTGKLDLSRFAASLKTSNKDLNTYYDTLRGIGPEGEKAFAKIVNSINNADKPMKQINSKFKTFTDNLMKTAQWQFSNTVWREMIGSIQSAFSYAQDLDKSLNSIRIVTGKSASEMANFAKEATKSAQALSTTTVKYTDAALIFAQQGLGEEDIKARTDAVIKMANVTGESTTEVSSYMTAIWNNFAKGSDDLERFSDVLTALGASTASSTAEIAAGLEKFASIGDTIGLSYDYATSILSAIVANTRQSADVVGTALRTIFARLQGLSLGDTLEDGVNLNKYSKALQKVGIEVLDVSGNMKKANDILDETALKWESLTTAQQTALAQTVAGTRQYSQFVAMMNNWDDVKTNISTAANAEGTIDQQAVIYADSWEAARNRTKAALEELYNDIIDPEFFKGLESFFAGLTQTIKGVVDGLGGIPGILSTISGLLMKTYASKMPEMLDSLKQNFMVTFGVAGKEAQKLQQQSTQYLANIAKNDNLDIEQKARITGLEKISKMEEYLIQNNKSMTESAKKAMRQRIDEVQNLTEQYVLLAEAVKRSAEETKRANADFSQSIQNNIRNSDRAKDLQDSFNYANHFLKGNGQDKLETFQKSALKSAFGMSKDQSLGDSEELKTIADILVANGKISNYGDDFKSALNAKGSTLSSELLSQITEITEDGAVRFSFNINQALQKLADDYIKELEERSIASIYAEKLTKQQDSYAKDKTPISEQISGQIKNIKSIQDKNNFTLPEIKSALSESIDRLENINTDNDIEQAERELKDAIENLTHSLNKIGDFSEDNATTRKGELLDSSEYLDKNEAKDRAERQASNHIELNSEFETMGEALNNSSDLTQDNLKGVVSASEKFSNLGAVMMTTLGSVQAFQQGFTTLSRVLNGEADGLEAIGAIIGMIGSSVATLNTMQQAAIILNRSKAASDVAMAATQGVVKTATDATTVSIGAQMAVLWPYLVAVGSFVAIFKLIKMGLDAAHKVSPEGRLEDAQKAAEGLKTSLDDAKQSAENLKTAFDNYESIVDKMKSLTVGTSDWKDAMSEARTEALNLMQQYEGLQLNDDGLLTKESMESVTKQAEERVRQLATTSALANSNVRNARTNLLVNDTVEKNKDKSNIGGLGYSRNELALRKGFEELKNNGGNLDELDEKLKQALEDGVKKEDLDKVVNLIKQNTEVTKQENQSLAKSIIESDKKLKDSDYADELSSVMGNALEEREKEASKKLEDDGWGTKGIAQIDSVNDEAKRIFNEYAESISLKGAEVIDTMGDDSHRRFKFRKADGSEEEVSLEVMRAAKAAYDASNQVKASANKLVESLNKIPKEQKGLKDILLNGDINDLTKEQLDGLGITSVEKLHELLDKYIGNGDGELSDEEAKSVGYDKSKSQSMVDDYNNFTENIKKNLTSDLKYFNSIYSQALQDLNVETLGSAKKIKDIAEKAYIEGGSQLTDSILNSLKDLSGKELTDTIDAMNKSLGQDIVTIRDNINSLNIEDETKKQLITTIAELNAKTVDATSQFQSLSKVLESVSAEDTSIKPEEFKELTSNLQSFFVLAADGTYKLKTSAIEFYEATKLTMQEGFLQQMAENRAIVNNYSSGEEVLSSNDYSAKNALLRQSDVENLNELLQIGQTLSDENNRDRVSTEDIEEYNESVKNAVDKFDNINLELEEIQSKYASTAENLSELREMRANGDISLDAYNTQASVLDAQEDLKGLDLSEIKNYGREIKEIAKYTEGWSDSMDNISAQNTAKTIMKMNNALETLNDNFVAGEEDADSWISVITQSSPTSQEYAEAMSGTKDAVAQLMDISSEYISSDFVRTHLEEITEAASGSAEAIDTLKSLLLEDVFNQIVSDNALTNVESYRKQINSLLNDINNMEIGEIGTDAFNASLQALIDNMGLTRDQIEALADAMNINVQWAQETVPNTYAVPQYTTEEIIEESTDADGKLHRFTTSRVVQTDMYPMEGQQSATAISAIVGATSTAPPPKLSGTSKKATGSANNYSSSNKGGKSSAGKSKSNSGSKGSSKSKEIKERQRSELDVYHDVTRVIAENEDALSKLEKKKSHYYGNQLIKSLAEENRLLQEQRNNYMTLGNVINSELGRLQGNLGRYGVTFNKTTGEILNYTQAYNQALNTYNGAIAAYNASAQNNADKTALENAKDTYDRFNKMISEYDQTLDKQIKNEQDILENKYKQIENNFKAWETQVEITLDLSQAKQEWTKFWQKVQTDIKKGTKTTRDYIKQLSNNTTNFNLQRNDVSTNIKAVRDIQNELNQFRANRNNPYFTTEHFVSETEAANALKEYSDKLRESAETVFDTYQEAWDSYLESVENIVNQWDEVLDKFDKINDTLDHYTKTIELLYGDTDAAKLLNGEIYETANATNLARLSALRTAIETLEKERQELLKQGAKETDEDVEKLTKTIEENQISMQSAIETYVQGLVTQFQNTVTISMSQMDKALTGGSGINKVINRWEDAKKAVDGYYDDVERVYEFESLESKWDNLIDNTSNLKTQQKLKDLQTEQLDKLRQKNRLSEYDIQLAEKQLAIAKAQAALEDARNNKNEMKLVRNEQGNWAYQYVADDEDVASKEQDLLMKTHEWYEFTKTAYEDGLENLMSLQQEAQERLTTILEEMNTADEERRQALQEEYNYLYEYYYGDDGLIITRSQVVEEKKQELNNATFNDLQTLYEVDKENYKLMTEEEQRLIELLRDNGINAYKALMEAVVGEDKHSGYYGDILTGCQDVNNQSLASWKTLAAGIAQEWVKNPASVQNTVMNAYANIIAAQGLFDSAVVQGTQVSGINFNNLSAYIEGTRAALQRAQNKVIDVANQTNDLNTARAIVDNMASSWANVATLISASNAELRSYLSVLQGGGGIAYQYNQYNPNGTADIFYAKTAQPDSNSGSSGSGSGSSYGNVNALGSGGLGSFEEGTKKTNTLDLKTLISNAAKTGANAMSAVAGSMSGNSDLKQFYGDGITSFTSSLFNTQIQPNNSNNDEDLKKKRGHYVWHPESLSMIWEKYDTGGYTGEWDNTGRLALLHQKELVLNQDDTKNILNAVDIVREIDNISDTIANLVHQTVSGMLSFNNSQSSVLNRMITNNGSNSNVFNISAEFPNAENVNEIREAIMTLPNLASQYLNKKEL